MAVHASLSQGYLLSDNNDWIADTSDGTFSFNEFALNVSYEVAPKLRAGLQIMSRDFGPLMNNKIYLDWAIVDYSWQNYLGLRFGRLKTPFGLYNESRDIDGSRIAIMLPQGVYPERGRDILNGLDGAGIYGTIDMGMVGSLSYFAAAGGRDIDKEGGTARLIESDGLADLGGIESLTTKNVYSFQLAYDTPLEGLRLVGSYLEGEARIDGSTGGAPFFYEVPEWHSWVTSAEYTWNNLILAGEFRRERNHLQRYVIPLADIDQSYTDSGEGWFISASYRFTDWFAAETYYSELYPNTANKDGAEYVADGRDDFLAWQKDISFTGRFDVNDNWLIKVGVTFSDGLAAGYAADYPIAGIADQNWILYQLKTTVSF